MADTAGITNGKWTINTYESEGGTQTSDYGMIYRAGAAPNERITSLANDLKTKLETAKTELDNPVILAEISALNGHYNSARQLQSNLMKSLKDTSQAIIRNM